jgi:ribose 5-phosphate isomerase A
MMVDNSSGKLTSGKRAAGEAAAKLIQEGMLVGLGTGSTSAYFIAALSQRCRDGLKIQAVASSPTSHQLALNGGIPLVDPNRLTWLDMTVDGADAVDPQKRMIKGGGGALLREKILAAMSKEMVVIIDNTKLVPTLGGCPLPVEILPFAYKATIHHIEALGYKGVIRTKTDGSYLLTDNNNYIFDIFFDGVLNAPEALENSLVAIPGVVETGLFLKIAGRIIVGFDDGTIQVIN